MKHVSLLKHVTQFSRAFRRVRALVVLRMLQPVVRMWMKYTAPLRVRYRRLAQKHAFMRTLWFRAISYLVVVSLVLSPLYVVLDYVLKDISYRLSDKESALVGASTVGAEFIKQTADAITYNREEEADGNKDLQKVLTLAANKEDATGKKPYQAELSKDPKKGIVFGDSEGARSISLTPTFQTGQARLEDERVIYPASTAEKHIYSFKNNGIKSDILFTKAPATDTKTYSWDLGLDSTLEARMLPDGGVGIYSADPTLYGNLQISDQKSQDLIDKARTNAQKNTLIFELPKPFILDANNTKTYDNVSYKLDNDTNKKTTVLTLTANNLKSLSYPLTIDPTITVTTTSDFRQKTGDTGNTDFGTDGEIRRGVASSGEITTWTADSSSYFATPRNGHTTVAYNGYMYVIGGFKGESSTACRDSGTDDRCNDVQYAAINGDGTLGTWATTSYFSTGRSGHTSVAYGGHLYVIGGLHSQSDTACNSVSSTRCLDVQYAPVNTDGTVGSWTATTSFTTARYSHTSVAYNGFLYIVGGLSSAYLDSVEYAPINANGTLGAWVTTSSFTTARASHSSAAYNGYLYVIGGDSGSFRSDVQYAPINNDGTIGTWASTTSLTIARHSQRSEVHNGYLYITGGFHSSLDTQCSAAASQQCSDTQYASINANGTIGAWTVNTSVQFVIPRQLHNTVIYNGYIYVVGGYQASSATTCKDSGTSNYCNDVQYAQLRTSGSGAAQTDTTSYSALPRRYHASVAYNGYLYILGGIQANVDTACKDSGVSNHCNDVQYAPINADGTIGTWTTDSTSYFSIPRRAHQVATYNGRMYILGGYQFNSDTACKDSGVSNHCNDVQYAPINADGTLGTWTTDSTSYFAFPRYDHTAVAYGGYLYVIGGTQVSGTSCKDTGTSDRCNDVQYAPINADGTLGTWATDTSSYFNYPRASHTSLAYNGYLYILGGAQWNTDTYCKDSGTSVYCNDVQYAPINADGTIGTWATDTSSYFAYPRNAHVSVAHDGYIYVAGGYQMSSATTCKNSGTNYYCNDVQYAPVNADGSLGTWTTDTSSYFAFPRHSFTSVAYNGYLYIMGGQQINSDTNCKDSGTSNFCNDVQYLRIGPSGGIDTTWNTDTSSYFSIPRTGHTSVAYNGYIYILGGSHAGSDTNCKDSGTSTDCSDVQYAPINADGTLGTWTTDTSSYFSIPRAYHTTISYNGYMYVIGGYQNGTNTNCKDSGTSNFCNDVQYAPINADGTLGTWTTDSSSYFSIPRRQHTTVAYNGYMYVLGGHQASSATTCKDSGTNNYCNDVQYAPINADGTLGTWTTDTSSYFSIPRSRHASVAYNGYMYVIGGYQNGSNTNCKDSGTSNFCNDVQYAPINADGTLGTWTTDTSSYFSIPRYGHTSVAYNGYIYILGGSHAVSDTNCKDSGTSTDCNDVQYAPINVDGTLGTWTTDTSSYFSIPRYGHTSIAYNGYSYAIGGYHISTDTFCNDGGTTYLCNDVQYASLTGIDQKARYERTIDTGAYGNILNSMAVNGAASCRYSVSYKTASSDGIFGSTTTVYNVVSGVTISLGSVVKRYIYVAVTLDNSTCGGQSTITSIALTYNAAPDAPTLISPANSATGVAILPELRLGSTDDSNDYLRYKIEVCSTSNCDNIVRTIDQTSSQTGWQAQSVQSGTAYTGGLPLTQLAIHKYQPTALSANTQYWWRAQALDPGGSNQWSDYSSISSFTTIPASADNDISIGGGSITIHGGTSITTGD